MTETITLTIDMDEVMREVDRTTAYTGVKAPAGTVVDYDKVSTTEYDRELLQRFCQECRAQLLGELRGVLEGEQIEHPYYSLQLRVSRAFDPALRSGMEASLRSYFVLGVVTRWFVFTHREGVATYASASAEMLADIKSKAYFKRRPARPTYE